MGATATMDQSLGAVEDPATGFEEIVYTQNPTSFVQGFWVFDLGALTPLTVRPLSWHMLEQLCGQNSYQACGRHSILCCSPSSSP